jgi:hypothetical protein
VVFLASKGQLKVTSAETQKICAMVERSRQVEVKKGGAVATGGLGSVSAAALVGCGRGTGVGGRDEG